MDIYIFKKFNSFIILRLAKAVAAILCAVSRECWRFFWCEEYKIHKNVKERLKRANHRIMMILKTLNILKHGGDRITNAQGVFYCPEISF